MWGLDLVRCSRLQVQQNPSYAHQIQPLKHNFEVYLVSLPSPFERARSLNGNFLTPF